jgi:hypothetical protein
VYVTQQQRARQAQRVSDAQLLLLLLVGCSCWLLGCCCDDGSASGCRGGSRGCVRLRHPRCAAEVLLVRVAAVRHERCSRNRVRAGHCRCSSGVYFDVELQAPAACR